MLDEWRDRSREPGSASRINEAFAAEERRGLELAMWARLFALLAIQLWLILAIPQFYTLYYHALIGLFLGLGLIQMALMRSSLDRPWHKFLFAGLDGVLLAVILLSPNPLLIEQPNPALALRYANIIFFFVFLAGVAMTYSPALVLWTGLSSMAAWGTGVFMLANMKDVQTSADPLYRNARTLDETVAVFLRPDFIHLNIQIKKMFVVLLVSALLAAVVWRARRLVHHQVAAERARTNLARYFSPNLVEQLAGQDQPLGDVRRQPVAVLFADIKGFTTLCEGLSPEQVVALLRAFHRRMEASVFACEGTLDKYIGDGLMATFGTPSAGPADATNALRCARRMLAELDALNVERAVEGEPPLEIGIGLHYGPVVQGDIGGRRRLEFTVLGDTVNIASRLQVLSRDLATSLVVSEALVHRLHEETETPDLEGLLPARPQRLRGRTAELAIRTLASGARPAQAADAAHSAG